MLQTLRAGIVGLTGLVVACAGLALPASAGAGTDPAPGPQDPAVVVTEDGTAFYRDEWAPPPPETALASAPRLTSYSPAEAFTLHSRPGAARTIHLDFDGGTLLSSNSWLLNGLTSLLFPGWSLDASSAFSDAERAVVIEVWARIAEDFAPFDIDVTTEEPAAGGLWRSSSGDTHYGVRVAFTSGTGVQTGLCSSNCGGVAWIGTFDSVTSGETRSPAWVFPSSLGNRAKSMAEAGSHEIGHTLGLSHDGTTTSTYYSGTSLWGPLMGGPYSSGVTQWSRGDYTHANNHQDDLAVAMSNGAPARPDEAGDSAATALPLASLPGGAGVIGSRDDEDWLTVSGCSGTVTAQANPAAVGPNLDIGIAIRRPDGTTVASAAPATSRVSSGVTGLGASVSVPLAGGPFHVVVSGVGSGSGGLPGWSSGGYDDYASLGTYRLTVSGCTGAAVPPGEDPPGEDPPPVEPPAEEPPVVVPTVTRPSTPATPRVAPGSRGGRRTLVARWSAPANTGGATVNGYVVVAYRFSSTGRVVSIVTSRIQGSTARRLEMTLPAGRWAVRVKARNRIGWSSPSRISARVSPR